MTKVTATGGLFNAFISCTSLLARQSRACFASCKDGSASPTTVSQPLSEARDSISIQLISETASQLESLEAELLRCSAGVMTAPLRFCISCLSRHAANHLPRLFHAASTGGHRRSPGTGHAQNRPPDCANSFQSVIACAASVARRSRICSNASPFSNTGRTSPKISSLKGGGSWPACLTILRADRAQRCFRCSSESGPRLCRSARI
mmetsp:Transcript_49554/g.98382  ORF Transcript_49554/g.98382 Transcript_49554/m.98382 type:complete len:206 (+) Transcript_49554:1588-2205(+)